MDDDIKISNIQDISQLERKFQEKLYELQNNTVRTIVILINT